MGFGGKNGDFEGVKSFGCTNVEDGLFSALVGTKKSHNFSP